MEKDEILSAADETIGYFEALRTLRKAPALLRALANRSPTWWHRQVLRSSATLLDGYARTIGCR